MKSTSGIRVFRLPSIVISGKFTILSLVNDKVGFNVVNIPKIP